MWKKDSLFLIEFRIENKDTIHKNFTKNRFCYWFRSPYKFTYFFYKWIFTSITLYILYSRKRADLPPGYEDGNNTRFSRKIGMECISCHNALSKSRGR